MAFGVSSHDAAGQAQPEKEVVSLSVGKGFLKYFRRWQVTTLVNLGTVFGMGLIVTTFMLAQSTDARPLGRAVLLGNIGVLTNAAIATHFLGAVCAGVIAHGLFLLLG